MILRNVPNSASGNILRNVQKKIVRIKILTKKIIIKIKERPYNG